MKDAYEVLYQKEADLVRVRQEVESLRVAASLLGDDETLAGDSEASEKKPAENALVPQPEGQATGTNGALASAHQPGLWEAFTRKRR